MEMDFGSQVADAETMGVDDEAQMRSAVDGLDDMEAMLQEGDVEKLLARQRVGHDFLLGGAESGHSLRRKAKQKPQKDRDAACPASMSRSFRRLQGKRPAHPQNAGRC